MIPAMALMIGAYIILRCLDVVSRPATAFGTGSARTIMGVVAALVIVFTIYQVTQILAAGASLQGLLR